MSATIVNKLPEIPIVIINNVAVAANVRTVRENLRKYFSQVQIIGLTAKKAYRLNSLSYCRKTKSVVVLYIFLECLKKRRNK